MKSLYFSCATSDASLRYFPGRFRLHAAAALLSCLPAFAIADQGLKSVDIVGLSIGMSAESAERKLMELAAKAKSEGKTANTSTQLIKVRFANAQWKYILSLITMGKSMPTENITVYLTLPPSDQKVYSVRRLVQYGSAADSRPLLSDLATSIKAKYGATLINQGSGAEARMLTGSSPEKPKCEASAINNLELYLGRLRPFDEFGDRRPSDWDGTRIKQCGVLLSVQVAANAGIVGTYTATITDLELQVQNLDDAVTYLRGIRDRDQATQIEQAKKNKPTL